ncbi:peptidase M3A and M3B domain-containing protein [Cavenderia fasciculata]|uniref:Peptidase M3A and M3B domain-containing protein n=1 Tax=Cavenderia fasciculata TaxID=261658 RepID=F4PPT1_CACFS|nr:peptidase M3A and M3B domain-containing protein [Cavenderia fasciculata]EGG22394.1 peptidase M3A and M3B domain-containing protein [Cavenderia fasciculata]|eukprot:XP_004360245.1 peptidase M3A and M3B domain-containing protein [Cavenderia fasciculata]
MFRLLTRTTNQCININKNNIITNSNASCITTTTTTLSARGIRGGQVKTITTSTPITKETTSLSSLATNYFSRFYNNASNNNASSVDQQQTLTSGDYTVSEPLLNNELSSSSNIYNNSSLYNTADNIGLFGIKELKTPTGWLDLYDRCHERGREILDRLNHTKVTDKDNLQHLSETCYLIDGLSQTICELMDPAELCRNVMYGTKHGDAADEVFNKMSLFVHELNSNQSMYDLFKAIYQHPEHRNLPPAHRVFVSDMMNESEINGIHLPDECRKQVIDLKNMIAFHGQSYLQESSKLQKNQLPIHNSHYVYVDKNTLKNLPAEYKTHLKRRYNDIRLDSSPFTLSGVMTHVDDPCIRKQVYQNNIDYHLESFINLRDQLAKKLKYPSYSAYHLSSKLIESPEKATNFLNNLSKETEEQSDMELNLLQSYKCKMEYTGDPIYQWDYQYYTNLIKNIQSQEKCIPTSTELAEYFTLENVVEGFNTIVQRLFGLRLAEVPMSNGESWHPEVIKLGLFSKTEGELGHFYLDPWYRPDKLTTGAANFVLHLGYRRANFNQLTYEIPLMQDYHSPLVAIICSFLKVNQPSPTPGVVYNHRKSQLGLADVQVLFHEFGHCIHSLLSRTDFQHLAGTRGPTDFAEIPSTLMENFVTDYRILSTFAHHHQSGRPISESIVNSYNERSNLFKAIETQNQITMAMLDLTLHGKHPLNQKAGDILSELNVKYSKIPGAIGQPFVQNFSHLYYYGSCYYSYLLSTHYSKRIWKQFFGAGGDV